MSGSHTVRATYTNDDDGIHLTCDECGWTVCVGYEPAVANMHAVTVAHMEAADR